MHHSNETASQNKQGFFARKLLGNLRASIAMAVLGVCAALLFIFTLDDSKSGAQALTDSVTKPEIEIFTEYREPQELFHFRSDAMDRGNHDYSMHPLVVDSHAFHENSIARGEVIVYNHKFFDGVHKTVSRVVGLPGESVEIIDGQVFIDDQKLDAFYGSAHRLGIGSNEEYDKALKASGEAQNVGSMKETFYKDLQKFQLKEDELFVAGDDWFRGSQHVLKTNDVEGKVLGYYKES